MSVVIEQIEQCCQSSVATPGARTGLLAARPRQGRAFAVAYLIRPPEPDVVVVTAKAPTFAPGSHPSPWPAPADDVRYWSMGILARTAKLPTVANKLPRGGTDYGCRADEATMLNPAGDYPT
jgi:hypothetical protein